MSTEDKMTIDERRKYLRRMKKRYVQAGRKEQGRLLDEMQAVTELHRKSLIRLMNGSLERKPRQKQRGRTYGPEVEYALSVIAESLDYLCAERLTPNLVWMASHLAAHGEMVVSPPLVEKLDQISVSTVERILGRIPRDKPRLPRKGPQHARKLTQDIPMKRIPWDEQQPGHCEVDLVHHCGPSASGEYVCTVQMIDVATGWSERRAGLGRSYLVMEDAFRYILARLPFLILELHPDPVLGRPWSFGPVLRPPSVLGPCTCRPWSFGPRTQGTKGPGQVQRQRVLQSPPAPLLERHRPGC